MTSIAFSARSRRLASSTSEFTSAIEDLRAHLPDLNDSEIRELDSLVGERDENLFWSGLVDFGLRLRRHVKMEAAALVFSKVQASAKDPEIQNKARIELDAIEGRGNVGARAEFLLGRFVQDAFDPSMILPMMAGSAVFQLVKVAAMGGMLASAQPAWWMRGLSGRFAASLAGYAAEVPTFALAGRAMRELSGQASPSLGSELASAAITIGALKLSGLGTQTLLRRSLGEGTGALARTSTSQVGMFLGLLFSQRFEARLSLRPLVEDSTELTDILSSMISLGVGADLGHRLLGAKIAAWDRTLEGRLQTIENNKGGDLAGFGLGAARLGDAPPEPSWMMMAAKDSTGSGKPRRAAKAPADISNLVEKLRILLGDDPRGEGVKQHYQVIGDVWQSEGDLRGEWVLLQAKREELNKLLRLPALHVRVENEFGTHVDWRPQTHPEVLALDEKISKVAQKVRRDIRKRFKLAILPQDLKFDPTTGFKMRIDFRKQAEADLPGFLKSEYVDLLFLTLHSIGPKQIGAIVGAESLSRLHGLDLFFPDIGAAGLRAIAGAKSLSGLQYLDLYGADAAAVRNVVESKYLAKLQGLNLSRGEFGQAGLRAILESPYLSNLKSLVLQGCGLRDEEAKLIAGSKSFLGLRSLNLANNHIDYDGVNAMAGSKYFPALRWLDLRENDTRGTRFAFRTSKNFLDLIELDGQSFSPRKRKP